MAIMAYALFYYISRPINNEEYLIVIGHFLIWLIQPKNNYFFKKFGLGISFDSKVWFYKLYYIAYII